MKLTVRHRSLQCSYCDYNRSHSIHTHCINLSVLHECSTHHVFFFLFSGDAEPINHIERGRDDKATSDQRQAFFLHFYRESVPRYCNNIRQFLHRKHAPFPSDAWRGGACHMIWGFAGEMMTPQFRMAVIKQGKSCKNLASATALVKAHAAHQQ